jgi:AcrR family transcriptional regulator
VNKKQDIILTAIKLFNDNSFSSIGVDQIIHDSSVAKMTFYKHFPSKEKLIASCLLIRSVEIRDAILHEINLKDEFDYLGKIKTIYDWYIRWIYSNNYNGCLFQKATIEMLNKYPALAQIITEHKNWLRKLIEELLIGLHVDQPKILTDIFLNIIDGLMINVRNYSDLSKSKQSWSYIKKLILASRMLNI